MKLLPLIGSSNIRYFPKEMEIVMCIELILELITSHIMVVQHLKLSGHNWNPCSTSGGDRVSRILHGLSYQMVKPLVFFSFCSG